MDKIFDAFGALFFVRPGGTTICIRTSTQGDIVGFAFGHAAFDINLVHFAPFRCIELLITSRADIAVLQGFRFFV